MLKNRKSPKGSQPSKLKKTNALNLKKTAATTKKSLKVSNSSSALQ
jgi:hypothetical protein